MRIITREQFLPQEEAAVNRGFLEHTKEQGQSSAKLPFALTAYSETGQLVGALDGYFFFDWLTVSRLWVAPQGRSKGLGAGLMAEAERRAKSLGCVGASLSTYDFQARPFYEKQGYEVFGVLSNNPKGHERFFLRKLL